MKPMRRYTGFRWTGFAWTRFSWAGFIALACLMPISAAADNEIPIPGMAPGTQNGEGSPFTGLAQTPGAELFTGSATTSIALSIPQGRLDMTPNLSLAYSSRTGRGPYGFGWSLATGRVSRSTKRGVPIYDNSVDTFVLELPGAVIELVADSGKLYRALYAGSYFKIGFDADANYWKVIDADGTTFTFGADPSRNSRSGPDTNASDTTFAWDLESAQDIYGNTIEYHYLDRNASPAAPRPDGLPDRIEYGGHAKSGVPHMFRVDFRWNYTPPKQPRRWEYSKGFAAIADDAWTLEQVAAGFVDAFANQTNARTYDLSYDRNATTEVARLVDIRLTAETSTSTVVLPETVFEYSPALDLTGWPTGTTAERQGPPAAPYAVTVTPASPSGYGFRDTTGKILRDLVDVNGDALVDSVFLNAGSLEVRLGTGADFAPPVTWPFPAGFTELRDHVGSLRSNLLDIDGDGLTDFVHAAGSDCAATVGNPCWDVYRNTGAGFDLVATPWSAPRNHIQKLDKIEPAPYGQATAVKSSTIDLNNDGLPDFVDAADADNAWDGLWNVYWNTGSGFTATPDTWNAPIKAGLTIEYLGLTRVKSISGPDPSASLYGLVDMNGDGLPDLLRSDVDDEYDTGNEVDHWEVWLNNGFGFQPVTEWKVPGAGALLPNTFGSSKSLTDSYTSSRELIDMTGDGLPDLVDRSYYFFTPPSNACPIGPGCAGQCPLFGGPQPPECCELVAVFTNTGSGFAAPLGLPHWSSDLLVRKNTDPNGSVIGPITDVELLDFDGDGLIDLLESDGTSWFLYPNWMTPRASWSGVDPSQRYKPNLLVSMMNGMGAINVLEYAPASLMPDQACQREAATGVPLAGACIPFPHWVVTTVETSDSLSSVPTTYANYAYADAKYDGIMREFRGFGRAATIDAEGRTIVSEYHQDAARAGRVKRSWTLGNPDCDPGTAPAPLDPDAACNPWPLKLGLEENTWGNPLDPVTPQPALLLQTRSVPYHAGTPQTHLEKTSVFTYDAFGNEDLRTTIIRDPLDPSNLLSTTVDAAYDDHIDSVDGSGMPSHYIVNRPSRIVTTDNNTTLHEKKFTYKNLLYAKDVETCRNWTQPGVCTEWVRRTEGRNALGLVTKSKTESKQRAKYYYDDPYHLYPTKIRDGRLEKLPTYDQTLGRPIALIDPAGEETRLSYDALGRVTERWGPSPQQAGMGAQWLLESIQYVEPAPALGLPGRVRRDAAGASPAVKFYDGLGREIATKTSIETTTGTSVMLISNLASYDAFGRPTAVAAPIVAADQSDIEILATTFAQTPATERTTTLYDAQTGKRTHVTPPDAATVEFEYRVPGLEIIRDATGLMLLSYIDALGRTYASERCVDPIAFASLTPLYECPPFYKRERLEHAFDGMDRPTVSWLQNLEAAGSPMEWLRATDYDGLGNEIRIRDRNDGEWLRTFDKLGLHIGTRGPDGAKTSFRYRKARLVETRVTRPGLAGTLITDRTYVRRRELGAGNIAQISSSDDLGTTIRTAVYTPRGLITRESVSTSTIIDGDVFTSAYEVQTTYDNADRAVSVTYPRVGLAGQLENEAVNITHNAQGQAVALTGDAGQSFITDIDYDLYGNTVSVDYGNQISDRYRFASQAQGGRLECIRTTASASTGDACAPAAGFDYRALGYERDVAGRITAISDRHNSKSQSHSFNYDIEYRDDGRLASATYQKVLIFPIEQDEYHYDSLGRLTERIRTDAQVETTLAYDYGSSVPDSDPDGPIVPLHRLQSYGGTGVAYDAAGRQTTKGSTEYRYDHVGRLREVRASGSTVAINQYDEGTSRVAKYTPDTDTLVHYFGGLFEVHIDVGTQSAELVRHFSLGGRRVASDRAVAPDSLVFVASTGLGAGPRRDIATARSLGARPLQRPHAAAAAVLAYRTLSYLAFALLAATAGMITFAAVLFPDRRRVAFATASLLAFSIAPIPHTPHWLVAEAAAQSLPGSRVYYHMDHVGSVQLVTDDDAGGAQLVESIRYRAYGEVRGVFGDKPAYEQETPPILATNAGYGGHQADTESALTYFGARHYDPELAMFLTPDAESQFASPFTYSAWDPINNFDADGNLAFLAALYAVASFVSQVLAVGFAIAAIVANPAAGPMAVVQGYVLSATGGGWKGIGTLLLSALARVPGSFQSAVQTAHVANTGLNAAAAIGDGDTLGAISSISSIASGNDGIGQGAPLADQAATPASSQGKFLGTDGAPAATPASDGLSSPAAAATEGPLIDAAYHVSRPVAGHAGRISSHNFIVTHADFVGDPSATVASFGEAADGTLARIDSRNAGHFSGGTNARDSSYWQGLRGTGPGQDVVPIPASSARVDRVVASVPDALDYSAVSGPFGVNSNSASQWVANTAAGSPQTVPGEPGRLAPGARNWLRVPRP